MALRILPDAAEAEDVVQEVFIKIWNKRHQLQAIENWEAFGMRMTRNLAIDKSRSKHKRNQELGEGLDFTTSQPNPHEYAEARDTISKVRQLMQKLPEKQRLVMELRDIEEMAYDEIAKTLNIPMAQVKVNLFRARKKIKKLLLNQTNYGLH